MAGASVQAIRNIGISFGAAASGLVAAATGLAVLPDGDGVTDGDEVEVLLLG